MHFYERIKQKFVYIYLFVLARRFYRFLKNFPNVGYDILERGYRFVEDSWLMPFGTGKKLKKQNNGDSSQKLLQIRRYRNK